MTIECVIDDVDSTSDGSGVTDATDAEDNDAAKPPQAKPDDSKHKHTASDTPNEKKPSVEIQTSMPEPTQYKTGLKHFREVLEDWEAFILDDQSPA